MTFKILTGDTKTFPSIPQRDISPVISQLPPYNPNGKKTFCYWTVADGKHGEMAKATVKSARNCGVTADFHIWTDLPEIEDATVHPCGNFDKKLYMFKFHFLKNEVSKLNYDYYVFFDADNFFVRDPGDLTRLMSDTNRVFVQMENDCDPKRSKRKDWWSCPIDKWGPLLNDMGVRKGQVWNTNAGFWIVERSVVDEFYRLGVNFFEEGHRRGYKGFTEEPSLAYIGHMLQKPEDRIFEKTNWLWGSDWTGNWKDKIPTGAEWNFEDYMSGEKKPVNPCIVHAMRSKDAMISWYKSDKLEVLSGGFWCGHNLLGDVVGFVAAAHLMYVKTGKRQKVWFQEARKDILKYFDGVDWVPREFIPNAIDAGRDPKREEWDNMNGVKRFYKWMDPSLTNPKTFDIHMKGERLTGHKLIGLITHANTQGDIPNHIVDEMVSEARKKYPEHKIVAIGNMDNKYVPKGVEDWRQSKGDIKWIVETVRKLDLLITPQTGPCFIAAGYRIPMWVYRSKESFWDNVLNYDTYKVERWWDREINDIDISVESDITKIKKTKNKYKKILCSTKLLNLLDKNYLSVGGFVQANRGTEADDVMVRKFCENNGFLFFIDADKYYCINYKKEHRKYEYIGYGTSCRAFKAGSVAVKIYHHFTEDYYNQLMEIKQDFIKFPKRISDNIIKCNDRDIHIIEEQFIKNDKSVSREVFLKSMESFTKLVSDDNRFRKIDLYLSNIKCNSGNIYLIDTHRRNKSEYNDFVLDRESWNKYMQKTITVDGNVYLESYCKHTNLVFESGELKLKEVINKEYNNYHKVGNTVGKRNCEERIKEFDVEDIRDKTILDIGCSMGGMMISAVGVGAKKCIGLEYNRESVDFIKKYCTENNISNIDARLQDIDDFDWFRTIEKVDTVFLLSILNTSNFSEKDALISIANRLGKVLYIEGHSGENHLSYMKKLYYHTDYTSFSHKYVVDGLGKRPLIRCGYGGFVIGKKEFK